MKRALLALAAVLFGLCAAPVWRAHDTAVAAATPTPAALQYDEINRMIVPPATPPAPGAFQVDYQALLAAGSGGSDGNAQAPPRRGGLGALMGSMMGSGGPSAMGNPEQMMERMRLGKLTRYTYYKGWLRTDDPVAQTAVIEKCQQHQYITLDLAKKTYAITSTQPPCPSPAMPNAGGAAPAAERPGTVDMTLKGTSKNLGPLSIDGIGTVGYDNSMSMQMANATGSCHDGDFNVSQTKYISQIRVPRPYCPLPKTMSPMGLMARGGCQPRMHVTGTLSGMNDDDRLVMFLRMGMGEDSRMGMVVERGNVKWFSGAAADALFTVPAGFTRAQ